MADPSELVDRRSGLPDYVDQATRNWAQIGAYMRQANIPIEAAAPIVQMDRDRIGKGQAPLSKNDAALAIMRVMQGEPITKIPEGGGGAVGAVKGFLGNVLGDVKDITFALPKIPAALVKEAIDVPRGLYRRVSEHRGPFYQNNELLRDPSAGAAIQRLGETPGLRFVPGVTTAATLGKGKEGVKEALFEHPLLTALDLVPYARAAGAPIPLPREVVGRASAALRTKGVPVPSWRDITKEETVGLRAGEAGLEPIRADVVQQTGVRTRLAEVAAKAGVGKANRDTAEVINRARRELNESSTPVQQMIAEIEAPAVKKYGVKGWARKMPEIAQALELMSGDAYRALDPEVRSYVDSYRGIVEELAQSRVAEGSMLARPRNGVTEFYLADSPTIRRLLSAEDQIARFDTDAKPKLQGRIDETRGRAEGHRSIAAELMADPAVIRVLSPVQTLTDRVSAIRGVEDLRIRVAEGATGTLTPKQQTALMGQVKRLTSTDPESPGALVKAREAIARQDVEGVEAALKEARLILNRSALLKRLEEYPTWKSDLDLARRQMADPSFKASQATKRLLKAERDAKFWEGEAARTEAQMAKRAKSRDKLAQRVSDGWTRQVPARWSPKVQEQVSARSIAWLRENGSMLDDADTEAAVARVLQGYTGDLPDATLREFHTEAAAMLDGWKAEGFDPVWVHHVPPSRMAAQITHPTPLIDRDFKPSQVKERAMSEEPSLQNPTLALTAALNEVRKETISAYLVEQVRDKFTRPYAEVRAEIEKQVQADVARKKVRPDVTVAGEVARRLEKVYTDWKPETLFPSRRTPATSEAAEARLLIPRAVHRTIEGFQPKVASGMLRKGYDQAMGAFRVSVLGLSPRWALYNIVGGMAMLLSDTGLSSLRWRNIREAWQMTRHTETLPKGMARGPGRIEMNDLVWDNFMQTPVGKLMSPLKKPTEWNFAFNELVDNFYRSLAYVYGRDKGLNTELVTKIGAERWAQMDDAQRLQVREETGLRYANRLLQNWDRMTPVERTFIRNIFPFASWSSHMMRFAWRYPADHPLRAAIVANFAKAEIADWEEGTPRRVQSWLSLGPADIFGEQTFLDFSGANPFATVADTVSLPGILSQTSPFAQLLMRQAGFDPYTASSRSSQAIHYDPETGQALTDRPAFPQEVLRAFIPQTRALLPTEFDRAQARVDPEAAARQRLGAFGIPNPKRRENIPQMKARDELARKKVEDAAWRAAVKPLRAGRDPRGEAWERAKRFPGLRATLEMLDGYVEATYGG